LYLIHIILQTQRALSKTILSGVSLNILILAFLFLNLSSLDYDYELINFNNSRIYSEQELLTSVGKTKEELARFKCDNKERFSLFTINEEPNLKFDSLRLKTSNGQVLIYRDQNFYKNNQVYSIKRSDKFLISFKKAITKIENTAAGEILIKSLQSFKEVFLIKKGWSHFEPNSENERSMWHINEAGFGYIMDEKMPMFGDKVPFKKVGASGLIFWDPNLKAKFIESDYVKRSIKPELVLAHEMFHAYDSSRGFLDRRLVKSDELEFTEVTEYRAVYLENMIREELGLKYRRYYGDVDDFSQPDLLNADGSPVLMPSPCIKWL